jgi:hypothetical protein
VSAAVLVSFDERLFNPQEPAQNGVARSLVRCQPLGLALEFSFLADATEWQMSQVVGSLLSEEGQMAGLAALTTRPVDIGSTKSIGEPQADSRPCLARELGQRGREFAKFQTCE